MFLQINNIIEEKRNHPLIHNTDDNNLPLRRFIKCGCCNTPMTGFLVKKKGLYYYKCRTKGCKNVKSAKQLHEQYKEVLSAFTIYKHEVEIVKRAIKVIYKSFFKEQSDNQTILKAEIANLVKKLDSVEEKYVLSEIPRELYLKYTSKYGSELENKEQELSRISLGSSNLEKCLDFVTKSCLNPLKTWEKANIRERIKLQNLMFPLGIIYNREKGVVQTFGANPLFAPIPQIAEVIRLCKKRRNRQF